jgi:hypothetical protein
MFIDNQNLVRETCLRNKNKINYFSLPVCGVNSIIGINANRSSDLGQVPLTDR